MNESIIKAARLKGVTRLCHFTSVRNLIHIAKESVGILSTQALRDAESLVLNATDELRLDGKLDHICCSIQYPNLHYWEKIKDKDKNFDEWVILALKPELLGLDQVLFCPRNAASKSGANLRGGFDGFEALFASQVTGAGGRIFQRTISRLSCCPTDDQAEVLIPSPIKIDAILQVIVPTEEQAKILHVRLRLAQACQFEFAVAPLLFDAKGLSKSIRDGVFPVECVCALEKS